MKLPTVNPSLADVLDRQTIVGELCHAEDERIRCVACGHRCLIGEGKRGICKVRYVENGELRVPFGYVAGLQCDPVEKKPFFHVYPSSDALTFGMMGCDLHCSYCQNWVTSQALRDSAANAQVRSVTPQQLVDVAKREKARLVVSSYNEPLITAEWAVAVFEKAKAAGLQCAFVSNGNATLEVLDFLKPWIIAYKVDLKSFDDRHYRSLGGMLSNITDTVRMIHERGIWLEIVTLVIPGFNDSERELREMARFLASVDRDIPWHVTAFHKDYHMTDPDATTPQQLMRACEIGAEAGLRYVYAGNLPGKVGPWENTRCPECAKTLIERYGYLIRDYQLTADGSCPYCQTRLPGIWPGADDAVRTGNDMNAYRLRLPRPVAPMPVKETPAMPRELSDEVKQRLLRTTGELVRSLVAGQPFTFAKGALAGLEEMPLAGAFVSLKRGKHLRSCCGMLGEAIPLRTALSRAAMRTVSEDERFPPVSPSEVAFLNIELWLLHKPERVEARGEERVNAITIGKHGIKVVRGHEQGLFLPSVAIDHGWDARRFLNQVCVKAGLPPTAWLEDATELFTFEGDVIRGKIGDSPDDAPQSRNPICEQQDLRRLADFCCNNIGVMISGGTPSYYSASLPDGTVAGVILTLEKNAAGEREQAHYCQLSMRPGVALQATLFGLCQSAAKMLATTWLADGDSPAVEVGVTILNEPAMHGAVADAHLEGIESAHRAIFVSERNKTSIVFDPSRPPPELLAEATRLAKVRQPAAAAVFSFETLSHGPIALSIVPQAERGPAVRPPAVAGRFYPGDAAELARVVDSLLAGERQPQSWPAAMVPHAGYTYSGRIAGDVLRRVRIPRTVIILGPKHTALGVEWAVAPHETWTFPGGRLSSDVVLAKKLCEAIPGLEMDAAAHQREHGIEVELPLLARLAPETLVVGIALGAADLKSCQRFAHGLADVIKSCEERPLLLISSDMNHYASDAENRRLDAMALQSLESLDPVNVFETVSGNQISMCGIVPATIVLESLRLLDCWHKSERVGYATSADVSGDTSRVVGYAGMLFG